jgi:hypothetical protein
MVSVVSDTFPPLYPWERDPVPIVQQVWWMVGPVWTAAENLTPPPNRIRFPDSTAHGGSILKESKLKITNMKSNEFLDQAIKARF